jgi:hypothetical protein
MYGLPGATGSLTPSRPDPAFGQVLAYDSRGGDHSAAVSVSATKRWSNGSIGQVGYQWSRAVDVLTLFNPGGMLMFQNSALDGTIDARRQTRSGTDVPHSLVASAVARLPFAAQASFLLRAQSGRPYSYTMSGDANADGVSLNDLFHVPRDSADVSLTNHERWGELDRYVESHACLRAQRGRIMARNSCRNPAVLTLDGRLAKTVSLGGIQRMEIGVDVFNLPNLLNRDWGLVRETAIEPVGRHARCVWMGSRVQPAAVQVPSGWASGRQRSAGGRIAMEDPARDAVLASLRPTLAGGARRCDRFRVHRDAEDGLPRVDLHVARLSGSKRRVRVEVPKPEWFTPNFSVLAINPATAIAAAVGVGTAVVTVRADGLTASAMLTVEAPTSTANSGALTVNAFSVVEFRYGSAPDQPFYAPQLLVTAATSTSVTILTLVFHIPGLDDPIPAIGCGGRILAGATRQLNGEVYGDCTFSLFGQRATGEPRDRRGYVHRRHGCYGYDHGARAHRVRWATRHLHGRRERWACFHGRGSGS